MKTEENSHEHQVQEQLIRAGKELAGKGLVSGRSGNISIRLMTGNILISATHTFLGMLELDDLIEIDFDGRAVGEGKAPSSERFLHMEIYKARPDVHAIVHTHSVHASAYAFLDRPLRSVNYENDLVLGEVPIVSYAQPGTIEFARSACEGLGNKAAALLQRHGTVAVGEDIFDALAVAELLEDVAKVNYLIDTLSK
ncbi:MAG TPA: class II aldolase/adducin family protein [Candidatus Aquicultor sp.]|jgi:L-fuculose-phosphate aldolase